MKHASTRALQQLAPLIERLRALPALVERTPGSFYHRSSAFLHFHEDPAGLFADAKLDFRGFERHRVSTRAEQSAFFKVVVDVLSGAQPAAAMRPFSEPAVAAHFDSYPPAVRKKMLTLRELVFATAARSEGVGELQETLKWGEPSYVTAQTQSGSTMRIDWKPKRPDQYAMYFHCQTGLIESFRSMFPNDFTFEGNRALIFKLGDKLPLDALAVCIEASLTYHARKRAAAGRPPKHAG